MKLHHELHFEQVIQHLSLSEEARHRLEVIAGQSLEVVASIKWEISRIRSDCGDPNGHIQELEQQLSNLMVLLDSFKLKVTKGQEQSKSGSSDTNSGSHTEVGYRQCIHIHADTSHIYKSIAI